MANEAKTYAIFRNMLRTKGYYDDKDIVVEEQKSDNAKIDKLLKNASKKGNKNGYPDFILYSKAYPELIIVVEAKADINIGSYPGWLSFGTADFCGAKIRAAVGGL